MSDVRDVPPQAFDIFVDRLGSVVTSLLNGSTDVRSQIAFIDGILDGATGVELRHRVSLKQRRDWGAFFTPSDFAAEFVKPYAAELKRGAVVTDPACGAGDLLLACAAHLRVLTTLSETIGEWGERLRGFDLQPEFVTTAKLRLVLAALRRGARADVRSVGMLFRLLPHLRCADGRSSITPDTTLIVLNPPYGAVVAPSDCKWAQGRTARAGLFFMEVVQSAPRGIRIAAILPDVLRTGSRYAKWRAEVGRGVTVSGIQARGQFDDWTDVDVFQLHGTVQPSSPEAVATWWTRSEGATVGDRFRVTVGPVVPFRDLHEGPVSPYIHPRILPFGKEIVPQAEHRRYAGTLYAPPFVVIRRTSRPGDGHRLSGTIISGSKSVAVENHLIILTPHDGTLRSCRELLRQLELEASRCWIDERLRCRHLTVRAIRELPWWES